MIEKQGDVAFRMGRVAAAVELWEECLEYHRSHLRLYRKHNPLWQQAVLRAWMAGQSAWRILRAGGGDEGRRRRAAAGGVLRLALFG